MPEIEVVRGPVGEARHLPIPDPCPDPAWTATVAVWVVTAPGHSPAWNQFRVGVISLRDIEGVPPAHKRYVEATHEFTVVALNPDHPITIVSGEVPEGWKYLLPLNVAFQFHGIDDDTIRATVRTLIERTVQGQTLLEPEGIIGGVDTWKQPFRDGGATVP